MLPEQEKMIYKFFVDLVRDCDLEPIIEEISKKDPTLHHIVENVKMETNLRHKNRCILFQLLTTERTDVFSKLTKTLRDKRYFNLANKLENKPVVPLHKTCCFKLPDSFQPPPMNSTLSGPLQINVTYANNFNDTEECYRTRSKNRGQVLIINNILFSNPEHELRRGADIDENNLKELFENMGFSVYMYRNLSKEEMENVTEEFATKKYQTDPDIGIVIIMSHGEKINNKTVIVTTDGSSVDEEWIMSKFNNRDCPTFRGKPKILIFNMCRGELFDTLSNYCQYTESDSTCTKPPQNERFYGDLLICHPTVEGFRAHRDPQRGSWYVELICKVFMEKAHDTNVETMFKQVEEGLKNKISENWTTQTSTMINIGFKNLYLNPGIYEENGEMKRFKQSI